MTKSMFKWVLSYFLIIHMSACAAEHQRDFDHNVQFQQKQLSKHEFLIEVYRLNNASFARMNVFVTRQGYKLCQSYGYAITYLGGVEEFDTKRRMPNRILPTLTVKISCPIEKEPENSSQW